MSLRDVPGQDERKRSTRIVPSQDGQYVRPSVTQVRKRPVVIAIDWVSYRSPSLLTQDGGLMYSQASVMPGNTGDSTACVIRRSEK